ncbi:hotdog fold thioesterase [Oceanobacillus salinisoli]|uniref:hotdog fold thioesterase n=1 Tax=Oceanobacillus salinisoli TaxID=2678611 RepID=UPI0012E268A0|nr:hotdog fold thioesterase [Oceanobacillus salinisoli]
MKEKDEEILIHHDHYDKILEKLKMDRFASFLGIEITEFSAGSSTVQLKLEEHMLNAHSTAHGGILYTLADYAFALACNSYGKTSVGLSTTVHFMKSAQAGDMVTATAREIRRNYRTGFYRIGIETRNEVIASIEAIAYRKSEYFVSID